MATTTERIRIIATNYERANLLKKRNFPKDTTWWFHPPNTVDLIRGLRRGTVFFMEDGLVLDPELNQYLKFIDAVILSEPCSFLESLVKDGNSD